VLPARSVLPSTFLFPVYFRYFLKRGFGTQDRQIHSVPLSPAPSGLYRRYR